MGTALVQESLDGLRMTGFYKRNRLFFWVITAICLMTAAANIALGLVDTQPANLIINEVMAVNRTGLVDEDGDTADWIELHNRTAQPINLSGWALTDDPNQPEKWPLPDAVLGPHEYLLIFASGKDRRATKIETLWHTNFKLNRQGEFLGLYNILDDRFADTISPQMPEQLTDIAYGRYGDDLSYGYLAQPTPGRPNDESMVWRDILPPVEFSATRGFYDNPFELELNTPAADATIIYTLNGSEPTETNGLVYLDPIPINKTTLVRAAAFQPGFLPAPINTHSYIFLDNVLTQPANPPGFPTTWGVHTSNFGEYTQGKPVVADYEMDPTIINNPRYHDNIKDAFTSIPTLSIVLSAESFHVYANPTKRGRAWERPASIEWIDPANPDQGFQINSGIRIQGGAGRWEFIPKHSLRLFFRDEYGASKLKYPLFANSPITEFDTLILHAGVDRSYAGHPESNQLLTTYTRDEWLRTSQIEMSGIGVHGIFVHLYLNGLYWGLYNVVERPDEDFAASYLGGPSEAWYVASHRGTVSGDSSRFDTLIKLARAGDLESPEKYAAVQNYLDITQFIDYMILNWYAGNEDWPENNWYATIQNPAGQATYYVWDGEEIWLNGADIDLGEDDLAGRPNTIKILFEALIQNPDFKMKFADQMHQHLFQDGALTDANSQARWQRLNNLVDRAIVAESARWGDVRQEPPINHDDWLRARDDVLTQMDGNAGKLIAQAQAAGYYPAFGPPEFNHDGGLVETGFELTMHCPPFFRKGAAGGGCQIYYTTNDADPRMPGAGTVTPSANEYTKPLVLTNTTTIKARILAAGEWSPLQKAAFKVTDRPNNLVITEIMYNPLGGNKYEFIELTNAGDTNLKLANMYFDQGISFAFPPGMPPLSPGKSVVLVHDPTAFAERYPGVAIGGTYQGKLSNKGETITLKNPVGNTVISINYDDENGWPVSADGRGDSLVLPTPLADPADPLNWRASTNLYGSPGQTELTDNKNEN